MEYLPGNDGCLKLNMGQFIWCDFGGRTPIYVVYKDGIYTGSYLSVVRNFLAEDRGSLSIGEIHKLNRRENAPTTVAPSVVPLYFSVYVKMGKDR